MQILRFLLALCCVLLLLLALACDDSSASPNSDHAPRAGTGSSDEEHAVDGEHAGDRAGMDAGPRSSPHAAAGRGADRADDEDAGAVLGDWDDASEPGPASDAAQDAGPPDPCDGDVTLETEADVAAVAQCTVIDGVLTIAGDQLTSVDLPVLEAVHFDVRVLNSGLRELELPALKEVGRLVTIPGDPNPYLAYQSLYIEGNAALTTIRLPALETAEHIRIDDNASLTLIELDTLPYLDGDLYIDQNDALTTVRTPNFGGSYSGAVVLAGKSLADIDEENIGKAGTIRIASPKLDAIDLQWLRYASALEIGPTMATQIVLPTAQEVYFVLSIHDNPLLVSFEAPLLELVGNGEPGDGLYIDHNATLSTVELPKLLDLVGAVRVTDNPELPICDTATLAPHLFDHRTDGEFAGNAGTCP